MSKNDSNEHYLKRELYELVSKDASIFEFLKVSSLDGVWYWDLEDQNVEWMSPEFWKTFGYSPEEKQHFSSEWQSMIFEEDLPAVIENFNKHCDDPSHPYDQVVRYRHKNGSTVWIRCRGIVIRDDYGIPHRMLGTHQDITELKTKNEEIEKQKERFELAANGASVGIWDWFDVNKNEEYWTPKFYELLGYDNEEIKASLENFNCILHPDDQDQTFEAVQKHFNDDTPFDVEYRLKTKSEGYRWFRGCGCVSRDADGVPKRMVGTIQDIHDQKSKEQELEKLVVQLKQSNDDLERFAYVASHDLQEPLRVVSSYVELLNRRYKDKLGESAVDFFGFITDGCRRMQQLITDLLDFSRVAQGEIEKELLDLNTLMDDVKKNIAKRLEATAGIVVSEKLPTVKGNRPQIERLFRNLLSNGLKYHKEGVTPKIMITATEKENDWHISVKDNGIGIDEKYFDRIFIIFQRLHAMGEYGGTGVGLAVCQRIVTSHNGKISLTSKVGEGSTFTISLPKESH